ncbi:DNA repair exonuclease [Desulfovibrio mangrovi]|uniref:metallophosphoesterase family protein n=1 Tax=Desulfovibrio mangrovi TaxID=2976983 RepID=UPI0022473E91|nr:DNA repair exonuclease [Desulfovibrio mangrovi]UZP66710.1 DNA repair exonuclease [Desulfovibrio mangrovi]
MTSTPSDRPLRFIHAADLHLDAAFKGIASDAPASVRTALQRATFTAFQRLVTLGCRLKPDAIILAGDIYNHEDGSLKAQLALRDGCLRLQDAGVRVFIAHGNHDPYPTRAASITLPDNVSVFGTEAPDLVELTRNGELLAVVHGISHASPRERKSLARKFKRSLHDAVQIGVLHCTLDTVAASDIYAPATLSDLSATGLDYWALGHIHEPQVVSQNPHAVYPGSPQGLHINEQGLHGCMIAEASLSDRDHSLNVRLFPLSPVLWKKVEVDISGHETAEQLDDALFSAADQSLAEELEACEAGGSVWGITPDAPEGLILRITLTGRGPLDHLLRAQGTLADLLERLRDTLAVQTPFIWVKDIELACRPDVDMDAQRRRPDLLGEALRTAQSLRGQGGDSALATHFTEALSAMFDKPRLRKAIDPPDADELARLLDEAELLCMDLLEADQ